MNVVAFLLAFAALLDSPGVVAACTTCATVASMDSFLQCASVGLGSSFIRQLCVRTESDESVKY